MSPRLQLMHVRLMHLHSHSRPRLSDTPVSCCCSFPWVCVFFEPQLDMLMGLFNECTFPEHLLSARNTSGAREGSPREPCLPVLAHLLQVTCGSSSFITSGQYSRDPFGTSSPRAQPASLGHVGTSLWLVLPVLCPWNPHLRPQVHSSNSTNSSGPSGVFSGMSSRLSCHFIYSASCVLAIVSWIYFPIIQLRKHHHCFLCSNFLRVPWTEKKSNQSILKEISPDSSLEGLMLKLKLQSFGHLM